MRSAVPRRAEGVRQLRRVHLAVRGGKPVQNRWRRWGEVPAKTAESDAMSKDLQKRGFRFVGSTICYAFMQATGMVNDHLTDCFRHKECGEAAAGTAGSSAGFKNAAQKRAAR